MSENKDYSIQAKIATVALAGAILIVILGFFFFSSNASANSSCVGSVVVIGPDGICRDGNGRQIREEEQDRINPRRSTPPSEIIVPMVNRKGGGGLNIRPRGEKDLLSGQTYSYKGRDVICHAGFLLWYNKLSNETGKFLSHAERQSSGLTCKD